MKNALTTMVRRNRAVDKRVTKANKDKMVSQLNNYSKDYGFDKLNKNSSIRDITKAKNEYLERAGYDILTLAVKEGNTTIAEVYSKDLRKSNDTEISRIAEYAPKLAKAKKTSDKKLSEKEKNMVEGGNFVMRGYGNEDVISLFEKTTTKGQADKLINDLLTQDVNAEFRQKNITTFERVFQKIGIVREDDIKKLMERLETMDFEQLVSETNNLLQSLELYGSPTQLGAGGAEFDDDETELANARLDDTLIKLGLKNDGKRKVAATLKKYKSKDEEE